MDSHADRSIALYGRDHSLELNVGLFTVGPPSGGANGDGQRSTAAALCVGGSTAVARKEFFDIQNEDCLYAFDDGDRAVHAIADGHHGHEASHMIVKALAHAFEEAGPTLDPYEAVQRIHPYWRTRDGGEARSRSTLLVASLDRSSGRLCGVNIGDSALFVKSVSGGFRRVVEPEEVYAAPWDQASFFAPPHSRFEEAVGPGDWLVSVSDGVTECSYRKPEESIRPADFDAALEGSGGDPGAFVSTLANMALTGVRGHPGGEDNIAIVASKV